ncbi:MAG: pyruvate formate-lyase-activating protein [Bacilli bacterium]|nr:pyruvate formate-lyase-activating protein [Bacilli bacterium]
MTKGSVDSIESFGLIDGPGIRMVVFLNGCKLRCRYCHNPEMWLKKEDNYLPEDILKKAIKLKPYFKKNNGGVTFSGGEPLLQSQFLLETCKLLKKEQINITLDTAGVGNDYDELLDYIDLVLFDIKAVKPDEYKKITNYDIQKSLEFLNKCQEKNKKLWIRQVIVPGINDNEESIYELNKFIKTIKNVKKIELLPYHTMAINKYEKLNIEYPLSGVPDMDIDKCKQLEEIITKKIS